MSNNLGRKARRARREPAPVRHEEVFKAARGPLEELMHNAPCLVCGRQMEQNELRVFAVFCIDSEEAHKYGGIPGRQRNIPYILCMRCSRKPDCQEKAEEAITGQINEIINSVPDEVLAEMKCIACDRIPDSVHVGDGAVFGTCGKCRRTKDNLAGIVAERLQEAKSPSGRN